MKSVGEVETKKIWILGREASLDGFSSADGKLLYMKNLWSR